MHRSEASKNEWVCPDSKCGNINSGKWNNCRSCDKRKKSAQNNNGLDNFGLGKEGSAKSKGLFSPEDWNCRNCGNINWARRSTCNVCNNPRVNVLGQRTGYGGGFMERDEVIEYKRRGSGADGDSDDEFDEFGRKRKKFRKPSSEQGDEKTVELAKAESFHSEHQEEHSDSEAAITHVDDDEEESGDDADLSKYDIWGADDEPDSKEEKVLQKPSNDKRSAATRAPSSEDESESGSGSDSDSSTSSSSSSASSVSSKNRDRSRSGSNARSPGGHSDEDSDDEQTSHPTGSTRRTRGGRDRSRFDQAAVQPSPP